VLLVEKSDKLTKRLRCLRKADFWRLNFYISGFDWSDLFTFQNMDVGLAALLITDQLFCSDKFSVVLKSVKKGARGVEIENQQRKVKCVLVLINVST